MKALVRTSLVCAVLTSASPSLAQDGPSYEETLEFLDSKLNVQNNLEIQAVSYPERCFMVVSSESQNFDSRGYKFIDTDFIPLDEMDPSNTPTIRSRGGRRAISSRTVVEFSTLTSLRNYYSEYSNDSELNCYTESLMCEWDVSNFEYYWFPQMLSPKSDNEPRVLRAMQHLIRLCGGEKELF